ncbi:MAG: ATP-binding cassette family protein [Oscillatoriales cyanobacterium]|nr:MAG: ATP-binding cassette family protein [Oscillatoriales cyanobacterium]
MIPRLLRLSNFFSYRDATLNFSGLNTACICGENGAGKSSLLEAISWSVWGKTRASSEDEIICVGERETRVDFTFESQGQGFRIIRSRRLGQASTLEFQVETPLGFTSITAKGTKATQNKILETLKLDYDTFINSAYLRQGRADEFMLKRPADRKQVLADLLKLDRYEALAKKAREVARQAKAEAEVIERQIVELQTKAEDLGDTAVEIAAIEDTIAILQHQQYTDQTRLAQLRDRQSQRQGWEQQHTWIQQRRDTNQRDRDQQQGDRGQALQRRDHLIQLLKRAPEIDTALADYEHLSHELELCDQRCHQHQQMQTRRHLVAIELERAIQDCSLRYQTVQAELEAIDHQLLEATTIAQRADELTAQTDRLNTLRDRLKQLDRWQADIAPLELRRKQLETQIEHQRFRIESQRDQLKEQIAQLDDRMGHRPQLETQLQGLADYLHDLEKKQVYLHRVQEKGLERRGFLDRLVAHENDWEQQIIAIDQKIATIGNLDAPCPLCDRPLDEEHWTLVAAKHQQERQAASDRLWVIREQMAASHREIGLLREEYRLVQQELKPYDGLRERRGQLQAQLEACQANQERQTQLLEDYQALERRLSQGDYAQDLQAEYQQLIDQIAAHAYDERDHSLVRSELDSLRWVEIERAKLDQAIRTIDSLNQRRPEVLAHRDRLRDERDRLATDSDLAHQLTEMDQQLTALNYNADHHNDIRQQLRTAQTIFPQAEALNTARRDLPQLEQTIATLEAQIADRDREAQQLEQQLKDIAAQLATSLDPGADILALDQTIRARRLELDRHLASLGRLQQQSHQLEQLATQLDARRQECETLRYRHRLHTELNQAFGKNGLQALTIETVLPQLEAETNRLLARLSANQLHVQFVTQKARKRSRSTSTKSSTGPSRTTLVLAEAPIETLEILIADTRGTRAYETYSGGEAFRINFAIRLALSRLLAQRSGASLQLLIVDEGFGTQDDRGRERLVSAIEAISSDFACILAVTHIPSLKEAFQTRIEVTKSDHGSQIQLIN